MRLRNLGLAALVATAITVTACASPEADQPEAGEQQSPETQPTDDASSSEELPESSEEEAQAKLAAELAAQGWNGPLDLDASHLDYGMGEVTIAGEVIPMTVTCSEVPYNPSPFYLYAHLEGTDSAGLQVEAWVGRGLDLNPLDPAEHAPIVDGYDGHEYGTLIVRREGDNHRRESFFHLSPSDSDPYGEGLPLMKATDDWRFSAVAGSDALADSPTEFALPIEIIGMCQEDWVGPFALPAEEWKARQ